MVILSNGGFGGIYEKLPQRLKELSQGAETDRRSYRPTLDADDFSHACRDPGRFVCASTLTRRTLNQRQISEGLPPNTPFRSQKPKRTWLTVRWIWIRGAASDNYNLPVWNSLYQVRDFSQYVNWVKATDFGGQAAGRREDRQEPRGKFLVRQRGRESNTKSSQTCRVPTARTSTLITRSSIWQRC